MPPLLQRDRLKIIAGAVIVQKEGVVVEEVLFDRHSLKVGRVQLLITFKDPPYRKKLLKNLFLQRLREKLVRACFRKRVTLYQFAFYISSNYRNTVELIGY